MRATDRPADDINWVGVLEHHATADPQRPVTVFEGRVTTYGEMLDRCRTLAAGLRDRGVDEGDVVGLLSYNCPEFLEVMFAANHLGAIAMPINWRLAPPEVQFILEHSGARVLFCDREMSPVAVQACAGIAEPPLLACLERDPDGDPTRTGPDRTDLPEEIVGLDDMRSGLPAPRHAADGDAVHRLMYTSGTTGRPKGVMLTHANLAWKNLAHIVEFGFASGDLGLATGPLYHVGALDLTTTTLIAAGACTIIHRAFDAEAVVAEIERSRVTTVWLAPAMVNAIMSLSGVEDRDLSSVRVIINGGEKMPVPLIERIQRTFPSAWFADAYGLTETVSGDTFLDRGSIISKLGSVGRPCLYLGLQVWDDKGDPVAAGEKGEIVLRGPKVFKGYWKDPGATEKAFEGGWFHTGDVGVLDEDGYLFVVDRLKDMIVSGGENIAGSEVERVIYEHADVLEAAVVARPHERWGEVPVAFVVAREGSSLDADQLLAHCGANLARFKVPAEVVFLDELPRNPSGKVLKRDLRESLTGGVP